MAEAAIALSEEERVDCTERGRALELAAAIDAALAQCEFT